MVGRARVRRKGDTSNRDFPYHPVSREEIVENKCFNEQLVSSLMGGWAVGRLGGWAVGRLGGWAVGRLGFELRSVTNLAQAF